MKSITFKQVVKRYVGSGIKAVRIRDQRGEIWGHSLRIRDHKPWDRGSTFFFLRDQGSGCSCSIFVGSGACICHAFDIKDQKYGYKKGISDEKKT